MARGVRVRRGAAGLLTVAAVLGVLLGATAFAVAPLPLRSTAAPAAPAVPVEATPTASPSPSPSGSASPSAKPTQTPGPPFTERALLQTSEFLEYGWAKASELSLQPGVSTKPLLRCVRLDRLPEEPEAAYAATYQGLHTAAAEQVARFADPAGARTALDQLVTQVGGCDQASSARRASVGTRHEPELKGVSETVWWNVRGAADDDPMRGVLALVRVDDRLVLLYLHATTTDPAKTTDILPLMRQAGLRLV